MVGVGSHGTWFAFGRGRGRGEVKVERSVSLCGRLEAGSCSSLKKKVEQEPEATVREGR